MRLPWQKGPAERKDSKAGPAVYLQTMGQPAWTPRSFGALADEAYIKNPIAYRSVKLIASAAAALPLLVFEKDKELTEHPFLAVLNHPNPFQSKTDLLEAMYSYFKLAGNVYMEGVFLDDALRELYNLRPDRMKSVPGRRGYPVQYLYTVAGTTVTYEIPDPGKQMPILHWKDFHPTNDHYGLSSIEPAAFAIDVHNAAGAYNKALLDNQARPSGALVFQGGEGKEELTDNQYTRLKKELEEKYQGSRNAGRPLLLEGGLSWQEMGITPKDMEFVEGKREAARDIGLAFGVPPMLLGIPGDNTYSNFKEANRALYRQTVIPLVLSLCEALTNFLRPTYGDDFKLTTDLDKIEALADERKDLWDRLNNAKFLSVDEKRQGAGYGNYKPGDGVGAKIYGPLNEVPLGEEMQPTQGGAEPDGDEGGDNKPPKDGGAKK